MLKRFASMAVMSAGLGSGFAQAPLATPKPVTPSGHAARFTIWEWTSVKDAEAYRITLHMPAYWYDCTWDHHQAKNQATVTSLISAALACDPDRCQVVMRNPAYSPLTRKPSAVLSGILPVILGKGPDCRTGNPALFSYSIQALRGRIRSVTNKEQNPAWKEESAPSESVTYSLDIALPDAPFVVSPAP
jgi:hypothetical protein